MTAQPLKNRVSRRTRRRNHDRSPQKLKPEHQWLLAETFFKLGLNSVLVLISFVALFRLIPYQSTQQQKLAEISMQVEETEQRVQQLRKDFNRSFDPSQSRRIMEELSPRQNPNQRRVILTQPSSQE
ncbi:MAG: hypothetical protein RLZZ568_1051 [Cyanobacteriota bacterium]|jgi:hypothetical protein